MKSQVTRQTGEATISTETSVMAAEKIGVLRNRKQNDDRRFSPNDNRGSGYGGRGRGGSNASGGYSQEYRRRDGFGSSKGNFDQDDEDGEPFGGFGGYRRDGQKSTGFGDRGRPQPRAFDDRSDDFDNRGRDRDRGNDRGRSFGNRKSGFDREDQDEDSGRFKQPFSKRMMTISVVIDEVLLIAEVSEIGTTPALFLEEVSAFTFLP
ncbi:hypothetical protein OSTOST_23806 [Ostertagia ostertagi]